MHKIPVLLFQDKYIFVCFKIHVQGSVLYGILEILLKVISMSVMCSSNSSKYSDSQ